MDWMFWTPQTAVLFGFVFFCFLILGLLDRFHKSEARKGFLPMITTRGDRFFWGMMFVIILGLLWLRFVPLSIEFCLVPAVAIVLAILRWG